MAQKNIKERLIEISKDNESKSSAIIAKTILELIKKSITPSLSEISSNANISKSSIVKFCSRLGFNGYIDFISALMFEQRFAYNNNEFMIKGTESIFNEFTQKMNSQTANMKNYLKEFEWLALNIKQFKTIYIYGSEENHSVCVILDDFLSSLNINVKYTITRNKLIYPKFFDENDLVIFIISGINNSYMETFFNKAVEMRSKIFSIVTEGQVTFFAKSDHLVVIRYLDFFPWYQTKTLIFNYAVNLLFYFINHFHYDYYKNVYSDD